MRQDQSAIEALPVSNEPDLEPKANRDQDLLVLLKTVDLHLHPTELLLLLDYPFLNEHEQLQFEVFPVTIADQFQPFHARFPQKHRELHTRHVD